MFRFLAAPEITGEEVNNIAQTIKGMSLFDVLKIVVLVIVLVILVKLLTSLISRIITKSKIDKSAHSFLLSVVKGVLWFVAITILASSLGVDITSLIAVLSVAGLAVSLALQGALANLAGGLVILTTKPFKVGDYVDIGGNEGFVEEITMTYTKIVSWDRRTFYVPNSTVTGSNVMNYSVDGKRRVDMNFSVAYENNMDDVKAALAEAVNNVEKVQKDQEIFVRLNAYEDHTIQYQVRCWCLGDDYWDVWFGLLEEAKRSFERNNIDFSYNHMNVHMDKE